MLAEGVCSQLGILTYHADVQLLKKPHKKPQEIEDAQTERSPVQVSLVQSVKLLPFHDTVINVKVPAQETGPLLFKPDSGWLPADVRAQEGLLHIHQDGTAHMILKNASGFTQTVEERTVIGQGQAVTVVGLSEFQQSSDATADNQDQKLYDYLTDAGRVVQQVHLDESDVIADRGERLVQMLNWEKTALQSQDLGKLQSMLVSHVNAFSLSQEERGETDLVKLSIQTGDALPKRLPVRRVPFALRRELAQQLQSMEQNNVIQPSSSP